jgi:hypothetical protein
MQAIITLVLNYVWPLIKKLFPAQFGQTGNWNTQRQEATAKPKSISANDAIAIAAKEATANATEHFPIGVPVKGSYRITSPFGWRTLPAVGKNLHIGIDIGGARLIDAPEDMVIKKIIAPDAKYPCRFLIKNGTFIDGIKSGDIPEGRAWTPYIIAVGVYSKIKYVFKHVAPIGPLKEGDKVLYDTDFCKSGNLGFSQGPHLHFETWPFNESKNDWPEAADPIKVFKKYNVVL